MRAIAPGEQPQIAQAQAAVDKAKLDLSRTEVRAPMDGVVENADNLQVGQMAVTGLGMLSLVHSQSAWVEANFKEKDVGRMVPGQRATIEVDAYPGQKFAAPRPEHRRGHRQPVLAAAGAERQRQLGQGDAARAGPDRVRRHAGEADDRRPVGHRHRLFRQATRSKRANGRRTPGHVATHPLPTGERLIVTIGVMMAVLLQVLDTTIANVALPHMQASLSATQDTINWVLTSYIVASAIALPISGWLADKVGRKRLLLISVVVFTVASVLCATATSLTEMVLFRALQGVGGAFIVPLAQATLFDINPREKHGQAMALFGGGVMIGPILGPVLGGWLTDNYNWRWVFLVNLPVGITVLLLMLRFMPKTETHRAQVRHVRLRACWRSRSAALQFCPRPRRAERLVLELGDDHRSRPRDRRRLDVRRPHGHRQASVVRAGDVRRPQFRDRPGVHGGDRRAAARRPRAAAAAAAEHVRLFGAAVGLPDRAARRRHLDLDADRRAAGRARSTRGCWSESASS